MATIVQYQCTIRTCKEAHHAKGYCKKHYRAYRRRTNIQARLAENLRSRLQTYIHHGSAVGDLGCSVSAFRLYIENQFEDGMSWDNYGDWHLDHVAPLNSFDLTNRQQFLEAANWLNYQPLWARDNMIKSDRL